MRIFKPIKEKIVPDMMDINDSFYDHSHGLSVDPEFTLCGTACEEWNYTEITLCKRITCPNCLDVIKHCQEYKL